MRTLPIDSARLTALAASAMPLPVQVWAELSDGSRRPVPDQQAQNEAGVPLWTIDALTPGTEGERAEVISVQVASESRPVIQHLQPVPFVGLSARVSVSRDGKARLYWSAESVATPMRRSE